MMNYFYIYIFTIFITFSFIGYGLLLINIIDKTILKINIGYIGLLGMLFCTIIAYITIFLTKHGYLHNIILHLLGITFFIYFLINKKIDFKFRLYLLIFSILFIGLLILRNHDDFNYYHLTYSLGLSENKLILGLGNLGHGYTQHSSIFFLNSILYLPVVKYYLFHSTGWITLLFINLIFLENILFKKNKYLDFEFFFYLFAFLFINFKFFRLGSYGTDISGQIILLSIIPLIYKLYNFSKIDQIDKKILSIIILLITYVSTLKAFMILNFLYLLPLLFFSKIKKIKQIFIPKVYIVSFLTIFLLVSINISYTGCAIYPVKQTCLEKKLDWSLTKEHVQMMNTWYQQWSKAGAGIEYRVKDPKEYIKNLNWVSNWYERYFLYKFKETLLGITFLILLVFILFHSKNKYIKQKKYFSKKPILIITGATLILFTEWFLQHPALRYGGYYLLTSIIFILFSYILSKKNIRFKDKRKTIFFLIFLSYFLYNSKNINRIKNENNMFTQNNFPLFNSPAQKFREDDIGSGIKIYIPTELSGCWAIKTPCIHHSDHVIGSKIGNYKMILKNK